jgi:hypothetical protein
MARSQTPTTRRILCTYCELPLDIAAEAKSVNCRHCNTRVVTEALTVKEYVAVRKFATANRMHITKKGIVFAGVRVENLQVDGVLEGDAVALGDIRVSRTGRVKGSLRASRLTFDEGATFVGEMRIGPDQVPELKRLYG